MPKLKVKHPEKLLQAFGLSTTYLKEVEKHGIHVVITDDSLKFLSKNKKQTLGSMPIVPGAVSAAMNNTLKPMSYEAIKGKLNSVVKKVLEAAKAFEELKEKALHAAKDLEEDDEDDYEELIPPKSPEMMGTLPTHKIMYEEITNGLKVVAYNQLLYVAIGWTEDGNLRCEVHPQGGMNIASSILGMLLGRGFSHMPLKPGLTGSVLEVKVPDQKTAIHAAGAMVAIVGSVLPAGGKDTPFESPFPYLNYLQL